MKKCFAYFAIFLLTLFLLSSCKSESKALREDGREIITLATIVEDSRLDDMINEFNDDNSTYYIQKLSYNNPYTDGNEKLMMDIIRGEKIDMLYLEYINTEVYIGKNMFTDIYTLIDRDDEVSRSTYVESVLKVFENNDKLFQFPIRYYLQTTIGKESVWGSDRNVSIENLIAKVNNSKASVPIANLIGDINIFGYYLQGTLSTYFDFENRACSFNDGRFEKLLTFAVSYNIVQESAEKAFINGDSLLNYIYINSLNQLDLYECILGNDLIFMGFPSEMQNYHTIHPNMMFAILSSSENQFGTFEFIKYYTSFDYQIDINSLPVNKEALYTMAVLEPQKKHSVMDETRKFDYECTLENVNRILEQINTVNNCFAINSVPLLTIINEELGAFFTHDKTAAEVCEIIQNRASLYLEEAW